MSRGTHNKGGYQSGQMGQTVNLLSFDFGGSNPSPPTKPAMMKGWICGNACSCVNPCKFLMGGQRSNAFAFFFCGNSSVDRALAFQAGGRGFEPRFPLHSLEGREKRVLNTDVAVLAQW